MTKPGTPLGAMMDRQARDGRVTWIGIRPARKADIEALDAAEVTRDGLAGDHVTRGGARAVTLVQQEHLPVIGAFLGQDAPAPELLRRNIAVAGINLMGLRRRTFRIGAVVLRGAGMCAPCSRMEQNLGPGGYSAVRHHGGICAEVITPGRIRLGDPVCLVADQSDTGQS
jgi:MOSC domain-containing protein YiiM